ncbi:MAG: GlyGly-CTERM sorting domain-containing protein [Colwellia sp.]|nr:GlyGly-CTERM sorting domain-containing protein [Colwellia sp.]
MTFKKTAIATFVGAALSTVALSATAVDYNKVSSFKSAKNVLAAKKQSSIQTVSGMQNQFDAQLGKTTFSWAGKNVTTPDLGAIATEHKLAYAADFYLNRLTGKSTTKKSIVQAVLANTHDLGRGARIAKYKQEVAGVEVFNREYNIMMDRDFNLVASSGYFADKISTKSQLALIKNGAEAFGDAAEAVNAAFSASGGDSKSITLVAQKGTHKFENFSVTDLSENKKLIGEPRAKKVFFEHKGKLVAAHYVEIETSDVDTIESDYVSYVVEAKTGKVLFTNNLKSHAADFNYRVYADETGYPWDSPHGNVVPAPVGSSILGFQTAEYLTAPMISQSHGPISTMDAWLADDATTTSGNNVTAYVDTMPPQGLTEGDYMADITSANTFDYSYDTALPEYSVNNRKAAIVNLFYMTNYLHDDYYDHGFDEAAGNGQALNFGRGGEEGDALNVEVQDNSGFNNANMSTPSDGRSPRMQMYLYNNVVNGVDVGIDVTTHAGLLDVVQQSNFGAEFYNVSGDVVRIDDATDVVTDGCEAAANGAELDGKIVIVDRGACNFTVKVKNAQDAGAIAVLIANNTDNGNPAPMGGGDDTVTIPNMGINFQAGAAIYAALEANETVSIDMYVNDSEAKFKGSSWDNGTVTHEWGHYISNRLVGNSSGLSNQQGRSMGEGFGDFHALLLLSAEDDVMVAGNEMYNGGYSDSTYTGSFVTGIRPYPYSTNMDINPSSFEDIGLYPDEVHSPGSIWGNMLWESFIGLVNDERHTFDQAKNLMKDYLVAGYKMMPIAPKFTEARDAILAAAFANDVEDHKVILAAFAKRGMGLGAVSPSRYDKTHSGVVETNKTELATVYVGEHKLNLNYEGVASGYCSNDNIIDKGETGTVSFTVDNVGDQDLTDVMGTIKVVSDHDVTLANDGMVSLGDLARTGSAASGLIEFTLNESGTGEELVFEISFPDLEEVENVEKYTLSTTVNVDFIERPLVGTSQYEDLNTLSRMHDFSEVVAVGGDAAEGTFQLAQWTADDGFIYAANLPYTADVSYETRAMTVGYEGDYTISFWHYYDMEEEVGEGYGYDGGVVEVSVNGSDWADVTEWGATFEGDGYPYLATAFGGDGRPAFTGVGIGMETINFGEALNGNDVKIRFRVVSDGNSHADGWYIDDMTFSNIKTSIFSDVIAGDTNACDNRLPMVSVSEVDAVNEGTAVTLSATATDGNDDELTYSWVQTAGTTATITGADMATATFSAPDISFGSDTLEFALTVSDGTGSVTETVSVTVNDIPAPVVVSKKSSSGGGSTGLLALLLLPLAIFRRRK